MPGRMPGEGENSRSVVSPECRPGANLWLTAPRAPVSLTRRLRRAVAVWPEEPGLTPAPTLDKGDALLFQRAAS